MCNLSLLSRLTALANPGILIPLSLVVAAVGRGGNISGAAPFLLGLAALTVAGVMATLIVASRAALGCADKCAAQAAKFVADSVALITALGTITVLIGLATPLAWIPFLGRMVIIGIFVALTSAGTSSRRLGGDLVALAACASAPPSLLSVVVVVLNTLTLIFIGALVITGLAGAIPIPPFPPR